MPSDACEVVHVVNQMRPGGIETMVLDLLHHSARPSRIFSLEGTTESLVRDWPALLGVASRLDGFQRSPGLTPALILSLARRLRELGPQAVFLHRISPLVYGGLAARIARVPHIVHVEHDVWHYDAPRRRTLLRWSERLVQPEQHFAVSGAIADTLRDLLPGTSVRVVPAGVDLSRFESGDRAAARAGLGMPQGARVVGSAGRLEPVKGHKVLIEAMQYLPTDVVAVIAGHGSERDNLAALASRLGVGERVMLIGHRDDLERVFPAFDVYCLPSLSEGLPRVVMEVQAADVPVVATDVGSVRRAICPSTGRLVPAADPAALAEAIRLALATPAPPGETRRFAAANFSLARMVAEYDGVSEKRSRAA